MRPLNLLSPTFMLLTALLVLLIASPAGWCQNATNTVPPSTKGSPADSLRDLQKEMQELKSVLEEMRAEVLRSRAETVELRKELEATRQQFAARPANAGSVISPGVDSQATLARQSAQSLGAEDPVKTLEEDQQLTAAKLEELHQTKVESASKYSVRLSGVVLLNLFSNKGSVENVDFPTLALAHHPFSSGGNFGGSLRQSLLGLEVFGPEIGGAKLTGNVQFDFAGGFPNSNNGVTFGLPRLRTGVVTLVWQNTKVVAGQDLPFFSPLSPTSVASLAVPEFSYAGNLWAWVPQVRVEHRLNVTENSSFLLQAGILDPLTGEPPISEYFRTPQAGEASRQPAYALRTAWSHDAFGHKLTLGVGGYYSRQDWGFHRMVDGWAGTSDLTIPLSYRWELSAAFYRGRAVGGLSGGIGRSVLFSGPVIDPATQVHGLNATGGWSQLKFRQTEKFEWNGGFGEDNAFARDLSYFPLPVSQQGYFDPTLARNRGAFLNFIYRPRSDLLFSAEYRRLRTLSILGTSETADHVNLSLGVLF